MRIQNYRQILKFSALLALTACLTACSAKIIVLKGPYPAPLVSKLPLTIGVYYNDALQNFTYTEVNINSGKDQLIIESGQSQRELFQTLLPAVFENVVVLESLDNLPERFPQLDAVFVANIDDFQLGLPEKTRLASYEIWIKYNMRLSEVNGDYIADWVMSAYGKSPGENSEKKGINNAASLALRDLAASFSLGLSDVPDIRDWLNEKGITFYLCNEGNGNNDGRHVRLTVRISANGAHSTLGV